MGLAWNGELFEEALAGLGVSYEKVGLGPYEVYHRFRENPSFDAPIPSRGWTARASGRPDDSALAFDRDLGTAWRTGEAQRPGQWFELDLGRPIEVSRIEFLPVFPVRIIKGPPDRDIDRRKDLARRRSRAPRFRQFRRSREALRLEGSGRMVWRFSPAEARWIRIAQTGHEQVYNWSIAELFVYAPSTAPERSFVPKGPPGDGSPNGTGTWTGAGSLTKSKSTTPQRARTARNRSIERPRRNWRRLETGSGRKSSSSERRERHRPERGRPAGSRRPRVSPGNCRGPGFRVFYGPWGR